MILRLNSVGAEVGSLQQRLFTHGYKIERTNVYDERTQAVVRQLQARAGLVVDGIYGPKTEAYLKGSETGLYLKQSDLAAAAQKLGVDLASVMRSTRSRVPARVSSRRACRAFCSSGMCFGGVW